MTALQKGLYYRAMRALLVLSLSLLACDRTQGAGPKADAAATISETKEAPSPSSFASAMPGVGEIAVRKEPGRPGTTKRGRHLTVEFGGASSHRDEKGKGSYVILAFMLENVGDEERLVSPRSTVEVVETDSGMKAAPSTEVTEPFCSGKVPPHGKLMCVGSYVFRDSDPPTRLKVGVDGAWFDIVPELERPDAGASK